MARLPGPQRSSSAAPAPLHQCPHTCRLQGRNTTTCALTAAEPTSIVYSTGDVARCVCAPDPFAPSDSSPWILCNCPADLESLAPSPAPALAP